MNAQDVNEAIDATGTNLSRLLRGIRCCVCACSGGTIDIRSDQTDAKKNQRTDKPQMATEHEYGTTSHV